MHEVVNVKLTWLYFQRNPVNQQTLQVVNHCNNNKGISVGAQLSRDIQNEPCYTSITLFCLKEIEFK